MSLVISSVFTYDTDAGNYIQAVETADGQALESATRKAINDFVIGCKQDGIWDAIKASCLLSGARTLAGALTPLVGTAPTNYNFVAGDYDRKTGLVGDGSTKYLDSNRAENADPQDSQHMSGLMLTASGNQSATLLGVNGTTDLLEGGGRSRGGAFVGSAANIAGFRGISRSIAASFEHRVNRTTNSFPFASNVPSSGNIFVFARNYPVGTVAFYVPPLRIAFYSIGESLDLAKLDGRVTDLINKFSQVIP